MKRQRERHKKNVKCDIIFMIMLIYLTCRVWCMYTRTVSISIMHLKTFKMPKTCGIMWCII